MSTHHRRARARGVLLSLSTLFVGCISPSNPLVFPMAPAEQPHALLRLDNRMDPDTFVKGTLCVNAWVDGVQPTLRHWLPYGVTELRLEAGKHEIIHRGVTPAGLGTDPRLAWGPGGTAYHATDPQVIDTILQAGRTYTIRFLFSGGLLKGAYVAEYEGWPPDEAAAWSRDHVVRSHLRGPDPFWLGPRGLRLAAAAAAGPADYVAVIASDVAFTVFTAFPANRLAEVSAAYAEKENVEIYQWSDFETKALQLVKSRVLKDEYPDSQVAYGITRLLRQYPGNPFGVTWNGGVAITTNDYQHAARGYETYEKNPSEYERSRPRDLREDPIHPQAHFAPLLGW